MRKLIATVLAALPFYAVPASAQKFPEREITFIVQYAAGGSTDVSIRALMSEVEKTLGVPVQVINRPGGQGTVGPQTVAAAKPDGYPPTRLMSPPDMQFHPWMMGMRRSMEMYLTGDAISGIEAAQDGFANRAYPADKLEDEVLRIAERVALVPSDLQQINKRSVHRAMEIMGMREALRAGSDLQALSFCTESSMAYRSQFKRDGKSVRNILSQRDAPFKDYRERDKDE